MAENTFTSWRFEQPYGVEGPGATVYSTGPVPTFRDLLDQKRTAWNRIPGADYPDGYLGTIRSRRDDRLLKGVQERTTQRSYTRGVHKGERIDRSDYFWPSDSTVEPTAGLRRQATTGLRHAPTMAPERILVNDGKVQPLPRGAEGVLSVDPRRAQQLIHLRPKWST